MAVVIEIPFKKKVSTSKNISDVLAFFKDPTASIAMTFPGLESLQDTGDDAYTWCFEKLTYGGYELKLQLDTQFAWGENHFKITPTRSTGHRLNAVFDFRPHGPATQISFDIQITLELPIPSLMRSMVQPLAQKELTKLLERFTDNIGKALA